MQPPCCSYGWTFDVRLCSQQQQTVGGPACNNFTRYFTFPPPPSPMPSPSSWRCLLACARACVRACVRVCVCVCVCVCVWCSSYGVGRLVKSLRMTCFMSFKCAGVALCRPGWTPNIRKLPPLLVWPKCNLLQKQPVRFVCLLSVHRILIYKWQ